MTWYSKTAVWWPYNRWPVRRLNCWLKELPVVSFISSPWTRNLWPDLKPSSALWPTCWTQNRYPYRLLFILKSRRRESLSPTTRENSFSGINGLLQLNLISLFKKYLLFVFFISGDIIPCWPFPIVDWILRIDAGTSVARKRDCQSVQSKFK